MEIIYLLFFALAVSMDGFAVGMGLGLGRIKMNLWVYLIISLTSFLLMMVALLVGDFIGHFFNQILARWLGGLILIGLGGCIFFNSLYGRQPNLPSYKVHEKKINSNSSLFSRLIYLLHNPLGADLDSSGSINILEALLLGFALAIDAFGVGLGAAISGCPIVLTSIMAGLAKFIFLQTGYKIGFYFSKNWNWHILQLLPGVFLLLLGLLKIMGV